MERSAVLIRLLPLALAALVAACQPTTSSPEAPSADLPTGVDAALEATSPAADGEREPFDPTADPAVAMEVAQAEGKRILLDVGGEWCVWCHRMDAFLAEHDTLSTLLGRHYEVVKVNVSEENRNEPFLGQYPEIAGYPHLFVVSADGELLHSQNTAEFEEGDGYDLDTFVAFLSQWASAEG